MKLSELQSIYINSLQNTAFANPNYRSENLKVKLKKSYGEKISFASLASTGKFETCFVYSSAIDIPALVQLTYQASNDEKLTDVALSLNHMIASKFKASELPRLREISGKTSTGLQGKAHSSRAND